MRVGTQCLRPAMQNIGNMIFVETRHGTSLRFFQKNCFLFANNSIFATTLVEMTGVNLQGGQTVPPFFLQYEGVFKHFCR